jgi:hypothetical protein
MPNNPDRPFGHDTLKLPAVFVPDSAAHRVSQADITAMLGYDAVKIPAVFVPEGGKPPGYGYERIGQAEFRPDDEGSAARRIYTSWQSSSPQSPDETPEDGGAVPVLPQTRFRFGRALGGDRSPGPPPNPAVSRGRPAQAAAGLAAGVAAWRATKHAKRTVIAQNAKPMAAKIATRAALGHAAGTPSAGHPAQQPADVAPVPET